MYLLKKKRTRKHDKKKDNNERNKEKTFRYNAQVVNKQ